MIDENEWYIIGTCTFCGVVGILYAIYNMAVVRKPESAFVKF